MCHLCCKFERIQGVNPKATKPILIALSKLHTHVEPQLGDIWLWRHDETTRLRTLLGSLYKTMPVKPLEAIMDEVNQEVVHIKKNMADHPPRRSRGVWNALKTSITPSESPSIQISKNIQLEMERRGRDRMSEKHRDGGRCEALPIKDAMALPELPGSNIDPPSARIRQSIRLAEEWLERCDAWLAMDSDKSFDNGSMVFLIGGGIKERPKVDVGIWRKASLRSWKCRSNISSSVGSRTHKSSISQISNCVYDMPSQKLELDMRIVDQVIELDTKKNATHRFQNRLSSIIQYKKAEKLSKRGRISLNQAVQLLQARQGRQ